MNLGFWDNPGEWASWSVRVDQPGKFNLSASVATVNEGVELLIVAGSSQTAARLPATGDWGAFKMIDLGQLEITRAGGQTIDVRPKDPSTWKGINLRFVRLTPATH
jgi:hypothetical protein